MIGGRRSQGELVADFSDTRGEVRCDKRVCFRKVGDNKNSPCIQEAIPRSDTTLWDSEEDGSRSGAEGFASPPRHCKPFKSVSRERISARSAHSRWPGDLCTPKGLQGIAQGWRRRSLPWVEVLRETNPEGVPHTACGCTTLSGLAFPGPRFPRVRSCVANLGYGVQPLRGTADFQTIEHVHQT